MIVTVRLLAWATLTLLSAMAMLASLTTPQWIVGPPTRIGLKLSRKNQSFINQDPMHSAAAYTWDIQPMYAYPGYRPTALCVFHQSRVPRRIQRFFSDSVAGHSRFLLGRSLSTGFDSYHLHRRMVRPKHSP